MSTTAPRRDLSPIVTRDQAPEMPPPVVLRAWRAIVLYLEAEPAPGWAESSDLVPAAADFVDASQTLVSDLVEAGVNTGRLTRRKGRIRLTPSPAPALAPAPEETPA